MVPGWSSRWLLVLLVLCITGELHAAAPGKVGSPEPASKSTGVSADITLTWHAPAAGANSYDVSFGTSNPPPVVVKDLKGSLSYKPSSPLTAGTIYYWQVTASNDEGATPGDVWSFTVTSTSSLPSTGTAAQSTLQNLGFGVALSLQWNILKPDIVNDATVDANGIVRVNTRSNTNAGFMLEMHYLMHTWTYNNDKEIGTGPFVAVQPGTDQIISAVGAGWMVDWKVKPNDRKGFGLGLGYAARPSAKTLGDEFVANQPAPVGPNGQPLPIRFETRDKGSVLVVLSFTF